METVKVTCEVCKTTKNIPNVTCTWQCPSCSKVNNYDNEIKEPKKKIKFPKAFSHKIEE